MCDKEHTLSARSAPEAGKAVDWETFSDPAYFDMWCVRQKDAPFGDGYHVASEAEAKSLAERLSALAAPQPVAPTGEIAGLVERLKRHYPGEEPMTLMVEAATALTASEAEAADLRRKLEEHQDAEDKAAREMATVIQGLRNRATAAERKLEEIGSAWKDTHAALAGAFDTPIARRRQGDEYAIDARHRLRDFNERIARTLSGASQ